MGGAKGDAGAKRHALTARTGRSEARPSLRLGRRRRGRKSSRKESRRRECRRKRKGGKGRLAGLGGIIEPIISAAPRNGRLIGLEIAKLPKQKERR